MADKMVSWLLRRASWYEPDAIEEAEQRATDAVEESKEARLGAEREAGRPLGSYRRVRLHR